jgi:hypothetical protein
MWKTIGSERFGVLGRLLMASGGGFDGFDGFDKLSHRITAATE